jgi:hypothetical protein
MASPIISSLQFIISPFTADVDDDVSIHVQGSIKSLGGHKLMSVILADEFVDGDFVVVERC